MRHVDTSNIFVLQGSTTWCLHKEEVYVHRYVCFLYSTPKVFVSALDYKSFFKLFSVFAQRLEKQGAQNGLFSEREIGWWLWVIIIIIIFLITLFLSLVNLKPIVTPIPSTIYLHYLHCTSAFVPNIAEFHVYSDGHVNCRLCSCSTQWNAWGCYRLAAVCLLEPGSLGAQKGLVLNQTAMSLCLSWRNRILHRHSMLR